MGSSDQKRPQRPTRNGRGAAGVGPLPRGDRCAGFFVTVSPPDPPRHCAAMKASARSSVSSFFVFGSSLASMSGTMPFLSRSVPSGV